MKNKTLQLVHDTNVFDTNLNEIFVVSQTCNNGQWNKLVKSQEQWWYSAKEAQDWLNEQPDWFQQGNKVFRLVINIVDIERIDKPQT